MTSQSTTSMHRKRSTLGRGGRPRSTGGRAVCLCGENHRDLLQPQQPLALAETAERRILRQRRTCPGRRLSPKQARGQGSKRGRRATCRHRGRRVPPDRNHRGAARTERAGASGRTEQLSFPSGVQVRYRPDAQRLRRGPSFAPNARTAGGWPLGHRCAVRRRLQLQQPFL